VSKSRGDFHFKVNYSFNNSVSALRSLLVLIVISVIRRELKSRYVQDCRNKTWKSAVLSFPFSATSCVVSHPRAHKEQSPLPSFSFLTLFYTP